MSAIDLETLTDKLDPTAKKALTEAIRSARKAGNRNVEIVHWVHHLLQNGRSDFSIGLGACGADIPRIHKDVAKAMADVVPNVTTNPSISAQIFDLLGQAWYFGSLMFKEPRIRTGHVLVAALKDKELRRAFSEISKEFGRLDSDLVAREGPRIWQASEEEPAAGSEPDVPGAGYGPRSGSNSGGDGTSSALDRFSVDMTAKAAAGEMDPVLGRDDEIRRLIDVLMRRRQNNPILTGEAGVGKTAVVEGFAQRIASGDVPPKLRNVRLCALDIGLLQAGASMKGEFEQRLRSVIDEVQKSPQPIILFVDEAHTLVGAGGAQGTGDAANLLKPALARGTLRTIGATTWDEYRKYFEKDPALTRRFQPLQIDEPDVETCRVMIRGIVAPMEKHHGVRISEAAVEAAVKLSNRYIPARQLPDKAVSLLDTASARVAISQSTVPAAIADLRAGIASLETERSAQEREGDVGRDGRERIAAIDAAIAEMKEKLEALVEAHKAEAALVEEIAALRTGTATDPVEGRSQAELLRLLDAMPSEDRMVHAFVDEQSVAAVVSDWTGIPVGRMVADELKTVLSLAEILARRVVGQDHGLETIAKRIEISRAGLDDPSKPVGVFMLCGPSGVGKTETALALAEILYGGEQNLIAINMSEFQEAHSVSLLKGAPPGYVGYGEGGILTEAVRRRPYSVVLLDEVEKAHPDVWEIFFQVFDKGWMKDGNGRRIDFKNTLIIMTSNVGTEAIMRLAERGASRPSREELDAALRPSLLDVFPAALLGRMVTVPYYPLSPSMLSGIVRINLERISKRIADSHGAKMTYDEDVVEYVVSRCTDPDSGGRAIDNIVTGTMLPALSREFLTRTVARQVVERVDLTSPGGELRYDFVSGIKGLDGVLKAA